jgi:hypothetical protein
MMSTEEIQASNPLDRKALARRVLAVALPVLFFCYVFGITLKMNLNDPDLYWHLKTGEYITQNWEVPDIDPFAYTSPRPLSMPQKIGLRSHWLGQVFFYTAYRLGGLAGVLYTRNLLIVLPMVLVYIWMMRAGASLLQALVVTSLPALMLSVQLFYAFERPQGLSFTFVLLVIALLERLRRINHQDIRFDYSYAALPLVMLVWGNAHAGHIVGDFVIVIYACGEGARWAWNRYVRKRPSDVHWRLFAVAGGAVLVSFVNPNGPVMFYQYASGLASMFITDVSRAVAGGGSGSWVRDVVLEYKPLSYFYTNLNYTWLMFYWVFTGVVYAVVLAKSWIRRELDLAEIVTLTFMVLFANMYARGIMFSLTVMPFYLAKAIVEMNGEGKRARLLLKAALVLTLVASASFVTFTARQTPQAFVVARPVMYVSPWYPEKLVEFVKKVKPAPPMYNYYTWGGFLIWRLYPEYQVFIDGRAIDNNASQTADYMLKTMPGWSQNFDVYNINFIAIPVIFRESGHIIPLAPALAKNDDWKLVFIMHNSALFVRNHPRNADIIAKYELDKRHIFLEILDLENMFLRSQPGNPTFNIGKAEALFGLERYQEAKAIYERYAARDPFSRQRLQEIERRGF